MYKFSLDNYTYDKTGNLQKDAKEGITGITWTVYGKLESLVKAAGDTLRYSYDASGNRLSKRSSSTGVTTVYVRDAGGNVLSVYEKPSTTPLEQRELHLYGSSRLGIQGALTNAPIPVSLGGFSGKMHTFTRGEKFFELTNHLGSVLVTVSDKKIQVEDNGLVGSYEPELKSVVDYAPFGMQLVGRKWQAGDYRYGFNGKENDNEVKGEGNQQDYGMRIYDTRLGRFLSVDPISKSYPSLTPYQFASNSPIKCVDVDGLEGDPVRGTIDWVHEQWEGLTSAKRWTEAAENVNSTVNPIYIGSNYIWKIATNKDLMGRPNDHRGRLGAAQDMIAEGIGYLTLGKLLKGLGGYGTNAFEAEMNAANSASRLSSKSPPPPTKPALQMTNEQKQELIAFVKQEASSGSKLTNLQSKFDNLAKDKLLPKYLKDDPNLRAGYTGSFKTGKVGNPNKPTYGQDVNLDKFDIDYWIESDILYKKYGPNLRADPEFRKILGETPGFEGLKANKEGFSIKFKPSSGNK